MKVTIDKTIPALTQQEKEEIENADIRKSEDHPEQFKKEMLEVKEVVMSEEVVAQLKEMGMTPDDLVAMMLKSSGTSN